jgi:hypothetical protein
MEIDIVGINLNLLTPNLAHPTSLKSPTKRDLNFNDPNQRCKVFS